jgi:hypothetical protein
MMTTIRRVGRACRVRQGEGSVGCGSGGIEEILAAERFYVLVQVGEGDVEGYAVVLE